MNVLAFYKDRMEPVSFRNNIEDVLILRRGKSMAPKTIADGKVIVSDLDTQIKDGEIITRDKTGEQFVIIAKQHSADCVQMQGKRISGKIEVFKFEDQYEDYELVGSEAVSIDKDIPVYFMDINAAMKQYDAGLLQKTVKKIIVQPMDIDLLYRVTLNGRNYEVVNVNTSAYVGLLEVQVAEDNRP